VEENSQQKNKIEDRDLTFLQEKLKSLHCLNDLKSRASELKRLLQEFGPNQAIEDFLHEQVIEHGLDPWGDYCNKAANWCKAQRSKIISSSFGDLVEEEGELKSDRRPAGVELDESEMNTNQCSNVKSKKSNSKKKHSQDKMYPVLILITSSLIFFINPEQFKTYYIVAISITLGYWWHVRGGPATAFQGLIITCLLIVQILLFLVKNISTDRWEYKVVEYVPISGPSRTGEGGIQSVGINIPEQDLNGLGVHGWELVSSHLEMETAFANLGVRSDLVTGIRSNVRPQRVVLIFKRRRSRQWLEN
jgi:hypothetical protein